MDKKQIDIFDMALAVENHFDDNAAIWAASIPLSNAKNTLSSKIAEIAQHHAIQLLNNSAISTNKKNVRDNLQTLAHQLSAAICGYASYIDNIFLYKRVYFAPSDFNRFKDAELVGECVNLSQEAATIIANLAPYGVLPATLTAFSAATNQFCAIMKDPLEAIAKRKIATEAIAELLPKLSTFLNTSLDNLIVALAVSQPEFVQIYHNVRRINSSPSKHWSITTICIDSHTEKAIEGVSINIPEEKIKRISGRTGFNTYTNISEGVQTLTASHPKYKTQDISFSVLHSSTTEVLILLVPL